MAASKYAKHVGAPARRPGMMERREYQVRAKELAMRGQDCPSSKLLDIDVVSIRSIVRQRNNLLKHIKENLSNEFICKQYGISVSALSKVVSYETWSHVA